MMTRETETETQACPNCKRPTDPIELTDHGGICYYCSQAFDSARRLFKHKPPGQIEREQADHHDEPVHANHPVAQFDFDEVSRLLGELQEDHTEDAIGEAADAFGAILRWCWSDPTPRAAYRKFAALSCGLKPDLLGAKTFEQIATDLGCTKQLVSKQSLSFADAFGLKWSRSRSKDARARMAKAVTGHRNYNRKRHKPASVQDGAA